MVTILEINKIYNMDCLEGMKLLSDECIDLTVTSPPYDDLRNYDGYSFDFENIAQELYRVTKDGGVVVWIVADATNKGTESGTSFKQALYFKEIGFNLWDTMIWNKQGSSGPTPKKRYENVFEYMFVLSKGIPTHGELIRDKPNKRAGQLQCSSVRAKDGSMVKTSGYGKRKIPDFGRRHNIWSILPVKSKKDRIHPAPFPEQLAGDHILSWSDEGDIVLDPFIGSGTTAKMAVLYKRNYIGFDISHDYCDLAEQRLLNI